MLILALVYFKATSELIHEGLEFPDFELVLDFLVGNIPEVCVEFRFIFNFCNPLQVFVIEFEIAIHYLLEKHLVVLHKCIKPVLCIQSDLIGVSRVGDFLSQAIYDLIECFEMRNILADKGFWVGITSFLHQIEKRLLIVCDRLPGCPYRSKNLR